MRKKNFSASRQEDSVEKQVGKEPKKSKQMVALDFVMGIYNGNLRFDDVAMKAQIFQLRNINDSKGYWKYVDNQDISDMVINCNRDTGLNITASEIQTVLHSSYIPHVHPLREYVNSLEAWNGFDWIDHVAGQVILKDPSRTDLWKKCFKKWFVAMVASWLNDEVVNHTVLVLIGEQGCGKTTWLEQLLPPAIRQYGCKMASFGDMNKDQRLRLATCAMLNLDELEAMSNREMNVIKSLITTLEVTERRAYRWEDERFVRLSSFCGSTNNRKFLSDPTGTRRWLPFEVEHIQDPHNRDAEFEDIIYRGMYAQAYVLANDPSFRYWFNKDDIAELEAHNKEYYQLEAEEELLMLLYDLPADGKGVCRTTTQISERLVSYGNIKKPMHVSRLGQIISKHGFTKKRIGKNKVEHWVVYERPIEELNDAQKLGIHESEY